MFRDFPLCCGVDVCMYDTNKEQVLQFVLSEVTWLLTYHVRLSVHNVDIRMICTRMYIRSTYTHPGYFNLFKLQNTPKE